jgi:site-specific DNA-methyltransferase (adenine-specific)
VIAGHTRLKAARKLGLREVPVLVCADLTPEKVAALRLADNKTAELAEWDTPALDAELAELAEAGVDMEQFGFGDELAALEPPANLDGEDADKPFVLKLTFKTAGECEKFLDAHRAELDGMGAIASVSGGGL